MDAVLENRKRELIGIEVKAATTLADSDFKGLRALQAAVGDRMRCGVLLYAGQEVLPFGRGLWAMPVQALWGQKGPALEG